MSKWDRVTKNPRIAELQLMMTQAQQEIQNIKESCSHDEYFIGYWSWRVGSMQPARICSICNDCIQLLSPDSKEYSEFKRLESKKIQTALDELKIPEGNL